MGGLSYPLLSDFWPHGKTAVDYAVLRNTGITERAIFIVDTSGVIRYIDIHDIDSVPPVEDLWGVLDEISAVTLET